MLEIKMIKLIFIYLFIYFSNRSKQNLDTLINDPIVT